MLLPTHVELWLQGTGAAAHSSRADGAVGAAARDGMATAHPEEGRGDQV